MKRKRFSVEQIVAVLKQAEAGMPVAELIRHVCGDQCPADKIHSASHGVEIVLTFLERSDWHARSLKKRTMFAFKVRPLVFLWRHAGSP
ncbi:hypothetical protein [Paraburkholderia sacchari]|uniref:hypothetical protein n=1 Tax=Paraburkholderia sacchari TaxID=159450 RepID=UPI001BCF84FA|nr:hypothetical protein [Paraburkholderia sacchari]